MRLVALALATASLGACGSLLSPADDGVELPDRPDAAAETDAASEAAPASDASTATCAPHPPCSGVEIDASGALAPSPQRLCLEMCLRASYDPNGFGDAAVDLVKIADVELADATGRVGSFNIGLARIPYLFADSEPGTFDVLQWAPEKMPSGRWLHVRVEMSYQPAASAEVFIDGELVASNAVPPLVRPPAKANVTRGPLPMGQHPQPTEMSFSLFRVTR